MTNFQLVAVPLLVLFALVSGFRAVLRAPRRGAHLLWFSTWCAGATAILNPDATRLVAEWVGVRRGADLVAYLTTISLLVFSFWTHGRLHKLSRQVTLLTRELARRDAERPGENQGAISDDS